MDNHLGNVLCSLCSEARNLVIAAPYIKSDALNRILADVSPTACLTCVTRWTPHDLTAGASDTECRTIITERGGLFRLHPALHAKYYRSDDEILIGSANLTFTALGWSSFSNREILCRPGDDFDASAFEKNLLDESREISDDEYDRWNSITQVRALNYRAPAEDQRLLDGWRPVTRDPRNLELAFHGQINDIASSDEQLAVKRDLQSLAIPPGFSNEQVRLWVSTCFLAAPFTNSVIKLQGIDATDRVRILADTHGLSLTDARREMQTVENWLAYLAPETLP